MKKIALSLFIAVLLDLSLALAQDKNHEHLASTSEITVHADGSSVEKVEDVYRVTTDAGRSELSIRTVNFDGADTNFKLLAAYTSKNGKTIPTDPTTVKISKAELKVLALTDYKQVTIPFDGLAVGSEVHLQYQITRSPAVKNVFSDAKAFTSAALAKTEYIKYISDIPVQTLFENPDEHFEILQSSSGGKYFVTIQPSAKAYSLLGLVHNEALVYLSTAKSWKDLRENLAPLYKKEWSVKLPEGLEKITQSLKSNKDRGKQIETLAEEIKKLIAYSGDWTTQQGKFLPANIKKTLFKGKGDCKDFSTIMTALLRNLGYEAYPFLTFRSDNYLGDTRLQKMAKMPNIAFFNHSIVWAKDPEGKTWWIDPTNPYVKSDVVTADILGNFGLLLDEKASETVFLPKTNLQSSDFKFEHTLDLQADNSVVGSGEMTMSPSVFNSMEMVKQRFGPDILSKVFSVILNPLSKTTKVNLKSEATPLRYSLSYHGSDWVEESLGKYKGMILFNSVGLLLEKMKESRDIDLGETGTSRVVTHIRNQKDIDTVRANCLIRSKWLDVDRYVANKENEILVTDVVVTKLRFIPKEETVDNKHFEAFHSSLLSCAKNISLVFYFDQKLKTAQFLKEEKQKGPALEQMTDKEAEAMEDELYKPDLSSYLALKLYRYNENKSQENKLNAEGAFQMAAAIASLGYLVSDIYVPEHLDEAVKHIDIAIKKSDKASVAKYYSAKIKYLLLQNKLPEAIATFSEMYKAAPKNFFTYKSGLKIAQKQNKITEAEQWAAHFRTASVTEKEKMEFNGAMFDFYYKQRKSREAIPFAEYLANAEKDNAWAWHNLAVLHLEIKDYDKVIQFEKKALGISEFGAAKKAIAEAYLQNSLVQFSEKNVRNPAAASNGLSYLLEALKYDTHNFNVLITLSRYYLIEFEFKKTADSLSKGEGYLKRASEINPKAKDLAEVAANYAKYKKAI